MYVWIDKCKCQQYNQRSSFKAWGQPSQFSRMTFVEERGLNSEFGRNNFLIVPFTEISSITMWVVWSMGTHLSRPDSWQYLNPCTVIRVYNKFPTMHFSVWSWTNMLGDFKSTHTATLFLKKQNLRFGNMYKTANMILNQPVAAAFS